MNVNKDYINNIYDLHKQWKINYEKSLLKIIKTPRLSPISIKNDIYNINHYYENTDYENIYLYSRKIFIALMFYLRNIRKNKGNPCGRGERYLSYTMALWLLRIDPELFEKNICIFVSKIGYYKDCLLMAKLARTDNYSNKEIDKILTPMAISLLEDEYNINKSLIDKTPIKNISKASKWAPREGKAFDMFIPNLQRLCALNNSKKSWRKFINNIVNKLPNPVLETLLSEKKYDEVDFSKIPVKAFKLYNNYFKSNKILCSKFNEFKSYRENNIVFPYNIVNSYAIDYFNNTIKENQEYEDQWCKYIETMNENNCSLVPIINISYDEYMLNSYKNSISLTYIISLLQMSKGFIKNKIIINNKLYDVSGNTLKESIEFILNAAKYNVEYHNNYIDIFKYLIEYCKNINIPDAELLNTKIIILTNNDINYYDKLQNEIYKLMERSFIEYEYNTLPYLILWNLSEYNEIYYIDNILQIYGCNKNILNEHILTNKDIPLNIIKPFFKIVSV